jgi:hypothetical protein
MKGSKQSDWESPYPFGQKYWAKGIGIQSSNAAADIQTEYRYSQA